MLEYKNIRRLPHFGGYWCRYFTTRCPSQYQTPFSNLLRHAEGTVTLFYPQVTWMHNVYLKCIKEHQDSKADPSDMSPGLGTSIVAMETIRACITILQHLSIAEASK